MKNILEKIVNDKKQSLDLIKKDKSLNTLEKKIKDQNFFNVRYQQKPFMIWIWISTLIIMLGGLFAIFKKNKEFNI